jgi:hypothetical protein
MRHSGIWPWGGKLLGFGRPPIRLEDGRHAALRESCVADARAQVEHADTDLNALTEQAADDYQEQDRRADRAERRASSIQAAVSTLLGLTIAGGGLLISSGVAKTDAHRALLAATTTFLVIMLVLAAGHALATQTAQHEWIRPNAARYRTARAGLGDDLSLETLGALTAAAQHNATIADWKYYRLEQAARTFALALASFVLIPLVLLVATLIWGP